MEAGQLISLVLLVCLAIERMLKNSKHCKSKCCCMEIEQDNASPKSINIEKV